MNDGELRMDDEPEDEPVPKVEAAGSFWVPLPAGAVMRSAEEIRIHHLEDLANALVRPAMYASDADCIETVLVSRLWDLAFIDGREAELDAARSALHSRGLSGSMTRGVAGEFRRRIEHRDYWGCTDATASVYAELAAGLGYFSDFARLPAARWKALKVGLRKHVRAEDMLEPEVVERYGEPSVRIGNTYCYAAEDVTERWVFFDFVGQYDTNWRLEKFKLRNVRLPAAAFSREFVFTPFGRQFKRGWPPIA